MKLKEEIFFLASRALQWSDALLILNRNQVFILNAEKSRKKSTVEGEGGPPPSNSLIVEMYGMPLKPVISIYPQIRNCFFSLGACHCDELGYLFKVNMVQTKPEQGSSEMKMVQYMTSTWAKFTRSGAPGDSDAVWPPVTADKKSYLEINSSPSLKENLLQDEVDFWAGIRRDLQEASQPNV